MEVYLFPSYIVYVPKFLKHGYIFVSDDKSKSEKLLFNKCIIIE